MRVYIPDFLIPSCCRLRKGVPEPMILTYNMLQAERRKKIMLMVSPSLFIDLLSKLPDPVSLVYFGTKPEAHTEL